MADGFTLLQGGIGNRIIHGDGRPFIMVAGMMIIVTDGFGCLVPLGHLLGLAGAIPINTAAGLHCLRRRIIEAGLDFIIEIRT